MRLYEVNLRVESAIFVEYRTWLDHHLSEMLNISGLRQAQIFVVVDPPTPPTYHDLCVQYFFDDQSALDRYLKEDAGRMRADGLRRFGERFRATRRILSFNDPLQT